MRSKLFFIALVPLGIILVLWGFLATVGPSQSDGLINPLSPRGTPAPTPLSLSHLSFTNLQQYKPQPSQIDIGEVLEDTPEFTSYQFSYQTQSKRVTGQLNQPKSPPPPSGFPVILMLRGFVDPSMYETGVGTAPSAREYAKNGYVTIAPDFLGYGGSDSPHINPIAARLQRPVTVLDLLASIPTLPFVDDQKIGLWGHSNGGQIALSILEITQEAYPTTLWAPVSKGFPYSILYYTDEYDDHGQALRKILAEFESLHLARDYSIDNYFEFITAPIQLHQGTADDAIPVDWSNELADILESQGLTVRYFVYEGTDHQLRPAWNTVVARDLDFYNEHLK